MVECVLWEVVRGLGIAGKGVEGSEKGVLNFILWLVMEESVAMYFRRIISVQGPG